MKKTDSRKTGRKVISPTSKAKKEREPIASRPIAELTLRRYEKPKNLKGRNLIRGLCLSLGILQHGDSRDIIIDILHVLLQAKKSRAGLTSSEIEKKVAAARKKAKLEEIGITSPNIRRQLRRLKDIMLVERIAGRYMIAENEKIEEIFRERIEGFYLKTINERIAEYCRAVDKQFR